MAAFTGNVHLVLLAGGKGVRAGGNDENVPKQFRHTGRGRLFTVSLESFLKLPAAAGKVASVTITVPETWRDVVTATVADMPDLAAIPVHLAAAGDSRTASTWNAINLLAEHRLHPNDLVAVHDTARPFADARLLARLVAAAADRGAAVPGVPVPDTVVQLVHLEGDTRATYLNRESLMAVQTPQVFRWNILYEAHAWAAEQGVDFTDDGGLVAVRGCDPAVVEGDLTNWKVTTDADWRRAEDLLAD